MIASPDPPAPPVEAHRITLAQAIHGGEDPVEDADDDLDDVGDDDFEFSDDELDDLGDDDLDLDLEDLDLDDLDLDDDNEDRVPTEVAAAATLAPSIRKLLPERATTYSSVACDAPPSVSCEILRSANGLPSYAGSSLYANTQRQLITSDADPDGSSGYIRPFVNGVSMRIRPCAMHAVWLSRVSASENASHSLL